MLGGRVGFQDRSMKLIKPPIKKLGTFQKLFEVVDKELSQRRPFGSLQSVDQLLDLG